MNKNIITLLLISTALTGCANSNGELSKKQQQQIDIAGNHFGDTAIPAYIALFPEKPKPEYINKDNTLNSQAVIADFSKNWNTYYQGQAEFINTILTVNEKEKKGYREEAIKEVRDLKLGDDISQDTIHKACAGNQYVQQSSEKRLSYYQCVFLNQMLNADRKIMVSQVYKDSDAQTQKTIDQTRDLAASSYLEMIKNSFDTHKWYQSTPPNVNSYKIEKKSLIIR